MIEEKKVTRWTAADPGQPTQAVLTEVNPGRLWRLSFDKVDISLNRDTASKVIHLLTEALVTLPEVADGKGSRY